MRAIERLTSRLQEAGTIGDVLLAGWEAFGLIQQLAGSYAALRSAAYPTWMWVIAPACEGRDILGAAPSMPPGPEPVPAHPDPPPASEDDAARLIASLAAILSERLHAAIHDTAPGDQPVCVQAAQAAQEIRDLLSAGPT